jgi:hypothetical protein
MQSDADFATWMDAKITAKKAILAAQAANPQPEVATPAPSSATPAGEHGSSH